MPTARRFIEVTVFHRGQEGSTLDPTTYTKRLLNVATIRWISPRGEGALLQIGDGGDSHSFITVTESYDEIAQLLTQYEVIGGQ